MKGSLYSFKNGIEQPSHASEVPQLKSFEDDQIPVSSLPPCKDPYLMDQEYLICSFAKPATNLGIPVGLSLVHLVEQ